MSKHARTTPEPDASLLSGAARSHALDGSPVNAPANFDGSEPRTLAGAASNYAPSREYSNGTTTFTTEVMQVQESEVCKHTLGGGRTNEPTNFNTERFLSTTMETFARTQAETNRTLREALQSIHHSDRAGITTWPDALACLRAAYGVQKPTYCVLREVFAIEQYDSERAEVFISRVRSLLVRLPYLVPDVM